MAHRLARSVADRPARSAAPVPQCCAARGPALPGSLASRPVAHRSAPRAAPVPPRRASDRSPARGRPHRVRSGVAGRCAERGLAPMRRKAGSSADVRRAHARVAPATAGMPGRGERPAAAPPAVEPRAPTCGGDERSVGGWALAAAGKPLVRRGLVARPERRRSGRCRSGWGATAWERVHRRAVAWFPTSPGTRPPVLRPPRRACWGRRTAPRWTPGGAVPRWTLAGEDRAGGDRATSAGPPCRSGSPRRDCRGEPSSPLRPCPPGPMAAGARSAAVMPSACGFPGAARWAALEPDGTAVGLHR